MGLGPVFVHRFAHEWRDPDRATQNAVCYGVEVNNMSNDGTFQLATPFWTREVLSGRPGVNARSARRVRRAPRGNAAPSCLTMVTGPSSRVGLRFAPPWRFIRSVIRS